MTSEQREEIRQKAREFVSNRNLAELQGKFHIEEALITFAESLAAPSGGDGARAMLEEIAEALGLPKEAASIPSCNHLAAVAKDFKEKAQLYFEQWKAGGESAPEPPMVLRCSACSGTMLYEGRTGDILVHHGCSEAGAAPPAATTTVQPLTVCTQHGKAPCEICYPPAASPQPAALTEAQKQTRDNCLTDFKVLVERCIVDCNSGDGKFALKCLRESLDGDPSDLGISSIVCGQNVRDSRIIEGIDNRSIVYYGPYSCEQCGELIVRGSNEQGFGDIAFDYPQGVPYPNHNWIFHNCKGAGSAASGSGTPATPGCETIGPEGREFTSSLCEAREALIGLTATPSAPQAWIRQESCSQCDGDGCVKCAAPPAATTTVQPLTVCTQHGKAPCEICYPPAASPQPTALTEAQKQTHDNCLTDFKPGHVTNPAATGASSSQGASGLLASDITMQPIENDLQSNKKPALASQIPRCPKCGSEISFLRECYKDHFVMRCDGKEKHAFNFSMCWTVADFAQFFPASSGRDVKELAIRIAVVSGKFFFEKYGAVLLQDHTSELRVIIEEELTR